MFRWMDFQHPGLLWETSYYWEDGRGFCNRVFASTIRTHLQYWFRLARGMLSSTINYVHQVAYPNASYLCSTVQALWVSSLEWTIGCGDSGFGVGDLSLASLMKRVPIQKSLYNHTWPAFVLMVAVPDPWSWNVNFLHWVYCQHACLQCRVFMEFTLAFWTKSISGFLNFSSKVGRVRDWTSLLHL